MIEAEQLLRITCLLLGIWGMINAAQCLVDMPHWRDGKAFGWDVQQLQRGPLYRLSNWHVPLASPGLSAFALIMLVASVGLIMTSISAVTIALLATLAGASLILAQRAGTDGGDKMALVVLYGSLLQAFGLWAGDNILLFAGILWTGGQLTISYFASGATKMRRTRWRSGEALASALSSATWGHPVLARVMGVKGLPWMGAWTLMILEAAFPLALLLPTEWLMFVLAGFLALHIGIALVMGLNQYVWAFLAAYPATLLLSQWVRAELGLAAYASWMPF